LLKIQKITSSDYWKKPFMLARRFMLVIIWIFNNGELGMGNGVNRVELMGGWQRISITAELSCSAVNYPFVQSSGYFTISNYFLLCYSLIFFLFLSASLGSGINNSPRQMIGFPAI
jgi:hypothetical protein